MTKNWLKENSDWLFGVIGMFLFILVVVLLVVTHKSDFQQDIEKKGYTLLDEKITEKGILVKIESLGKRQDQLWDIMIPLKGYNDGINNFEIQIISPKEECYYAFNSSLLDYWFSANPSENQTEALVRWHKVNDELGRTEVCH